MTRLTSEGVVSGYGGRPVVRGVDLDIPTASITAIVGANGCGKSTLLRTIARLLTPTKGAVVLDGRSIHRIPTREVATQVGLLPQSPTAPAGITVRELVSRGRVPHQRWLRPWSAADEAAVASALEATSLEDLAHASVDELSGGQRQRAWIAMALAQDTPLLLLDEPTTHLDIAHQYDVLDLLQRLNREQEKTTVMVIHDLHQAALYADHLVVMSHGTVLASGHPSEVLTESLVAAAFGFDSRIVPDPLTGVPLVLPAPRPGVAH